MVRMTAPPHPEMGSYPPNSSLLGSLGSARCEHTGTAQSKPTGLKSQNTLSGKKFFAKGFLPRPASSIPNTESRCLKFPLSDQ